MLGAIGSKFLKLFKKADKPNDVVKELRDAEKIVKGLVKLYLLQLKMLVITQRLWGLYKVYKF